MPASTFIPNSTTSTLLCKLFSEYRAGSETSGTLNALREALGPEEYANFESDLQQLLKKKRAWRAVEDIITAAMVRKRAALPGVAHRRDDRATAKAQRLLEEEARAAHGH